MRVQDVVVAGTGTSCAVKTRETGAVPVQCSKQLVLMHLNESSTYVLGVVGAHRERERCSKMSCMVKKSDIQECPAQCARWSVLMHVKML
jgi:hypothetical protein